MLASEGVGPTPDWFAPPLEPTRQSTVPRPDTHCVAEDDAGQPLPIIGGRTQIGVVFLMCVLMGMTFGVLFGALDVGTFGTAPFACFFCLIDWVGLVCS